MKILKMKQMSIEEEDKYTIRLLRQEYYLIGQQLTYKMITQDEYDEMMQKLLLKIKSLEDKYGIGKTAEA